MINTSNLLWCLINLFSILIIKEYLNIFFTAKPISIHNVLSWFVCFAWQIIGSFINELPPMVNLMISIILIAWIAVAAYEGTIQKKIVLSLLINVLWVLSELIAGNILVKINFNFQMSQFIGAIISKLILLVIVKGIYIWGKNYMMTELPLRYWNRLLLIPIGSIIIILNIFMLDNESGQKDFRLITFISYILLLWFNIGIFKIFEKFSNELELRNSNSIYERQIELSEKYILENEKILFSIRRIQHDMKHHYLYLKLLLQNKEFRKLEEYFEQLESMDSIKTKIGVVCSHNLIVDSILNYKYWQAQERKIKFEFSINVMAHLPFEDADICLLLGNALDNALEATLKCKEYQRIVKVFISCKQGTLLITIINSFAEKLKRDKSGKLLTTKKNTVNHGVGLTTIAKVAEKYSGICQTDNNNREFILKILLYMPEENYM